MQHDSVDLFAQKSEVAKHATVKKARVAREDELKMILSFQPASLFDKYQKALSVFTTFGMMRVDDCRFVSQ